MAEVSSQLKRQREEEETIFEEYHYDEQQKRQKTEKNQILSILEEDEDHELNQDLSDIFTTLEQELSSSESTTNVDQYPLLSEAEIIDHHHQQTTTTTPDSSPSFSKEDEEHDSYNVMRHLLEASDDELGLPNKMDGGDDDEVIEIYGGDFPFSLSNGLWEFEDETANYYTMLQSELFM